jgi:hypothetical protein
MNCSFACGSKFTYGIGYTEVTLVHNIHLFCNNMDEITVEPSYNDVGLYDTSSIASDNLWYHLIPHREP